MTPLDEIPDVQFVAVAASEQNLRIDSLIHHVWSSPFAGDESVESQVPPEIISKFLRTSLQLPLPENIEAFVIHHKNSAGTIAVGGSKRVHQDSVGAAMNRVRRCVSRARG